LKFILDAKEKILELGLLDRPDIATAIDCDVVDRVRARFGGSQISLAVAADAVLVCNGSFDAACEHLRAQLGIEPPEEVQAAPTDLSDPLLVEIQRRLKDSGAHRQLPSIKTIGIAVMVLRDANCGLLKACAAYGLDCYSQRHTRHIRERIDDVCTRIKDLGLLQPAAKDIVLNGTAKDIVLNGTEGSPLETAESSGAAVTLSLNVLPHHNLEWMLNVQTRIGETSAAGTKARLPEYRELSVALQYSSVKGIDLDSLCQKWDLELKRGTLNFIRTLRDRIKLLGLVAVHPQELLVPTPEPYNETFLSRIKLRLTKSHHQPPNIENIIVALDVFHQPALRPILGCVRRRFDASANRLRAIEKVVADLHALKAPLDARIDAADVERLLGLFRRAAVNVPSVQEACDALVENSSDMLGAFNRLMADAGEPPMDLASLLVLEQGSEDAQVESDLSEPIARRERPFPISDEVLAEIQDRLCVRLKRSKGQLPNPKWIRAAADLLREDVRDVHWKHLNVDEVCEWHGIELQGYMKRLYDLRQHIKCFGRLELLDAVCRARATNRTCPKQTAEKETLFHNLQLQLQTAKPGACSSSRPPCAASTIASAVEMCQNPNFNLLESCAANGINVQSRNVFERIAQCRDRIVELGLLEKQSTVRIRREDVDELRAVAVGVSVAQAATAILENDGNIPAAFEDLQKILSLRSLPLGVGPYKPAADFEVVPVPSQAVMQTGLHVRTGFMRDRKLMQLFDYPTGWQEGTVVRRCVRQGKPSNVYDIKYADGFTMTQECDPDEYGATNGKKWCIIQPIQREDVEGHGCESEEEVV
jgi:hypothetical protein